MAKKTAIVLFNLGGPNGEKTIRPFLKNFFMDKNIIAAPLPIRWFLSEWISRTRSKGAAKTAYAALGYVSPLLENTEKQAKALEAELNDPKTKVFVSMRYWHPLAEETIRLLEDYQPERLVLLPLYPQFSTTTSGSSFADFWASVQQEDGDLHARWDDITVDEICCYPLNEGFIKASADLIQQEIDKAPAGTRILFSAHGLPEKVIESGDPYQYQCEKTAEAIVDQLNIKDLDWQICYQSRVGPLKWIGPSTAEALQKAAEDQKSVILYSHAFVSEHVETLVEIDIEYREEAKEMGIPYFSRAQTVGTHPAFIKGLANIVREIADQKTMPKICPAHCQRAACAKRV